MHACPAGADEAGDRTLLRPRVPVSGAVVEDRIEVVHLVAAHPVGRDGVQRRVLAEVLHPAVVAVADRLVEQVAVEGVRPGMGEVELADEERVVGAGRVPVQRRRPGGSLGQQAALGGWVERPRVAGADHGVEVSRDRVADPVEAGGSRRLLGLDASLIAARQVVKVGIGGGRRHVGLPQSRGLVERRLLAVRLVPRAEEPRCRGVGLATREAREAAECIGRLGPREEPELERVGIDLEAPAVRALGPELEATALGVADQHPVSATGEQPGHGEVRRVVAIALPVGRDEEIDDRPLGGLVGAVGDVVVDLVPALVDRVGALAEAEEALVGGARRSRRRSRSPPARPLRSPAGG